MEVELEKDKVEKLKKEGENAQSTIKLLMEENMLANAEVKACQNTTAYVPDSLFKRERGE